MRDLKNQIGLNLTSQYSDVVCGAEVDYCFGPFVIGTYQFGITEPNCNKGKCGKRSCQDVHINFRIEEATEDPTIPWQNEFDLHVFIYQDTNNQSCLYIWEEKSFGDVIDICSDVFHMINNLKRIWKTMALIGAGEVLEGVELVLSDLTLDLLVELLLVLLL